FSFTAGGAAAAPEKEPVPRQDQAPPPRPGSPSEATEDATATPATPTTPASPGGPAPPAPAEAAGGAEDARGAPATVVGPPPVGPPPSDPAGAAEGAEAAAHARSRVVEPPHVDPVVTPPEVPEEEIPAPSADEITPPPEPVAPIERIDPATGRLERLRGRLARSQNTVGQGLLGLLGAGDLDEDAWEEIEDTLIMADLGAPMSAQVVHRLREDSATRQALIDNLHPEYDRSTRALPHEGTPAVLLVVGVNGTGKTTTTGKLARVLIAEGRDILLGAADTFRAAAADQLQTWGERVGAEVVRGDEGADPASVAFDAVARGVDTGVDAVLVDTAGRLHTKAGLMDELGKVKRVVEKKTPVDEVLLVIDATTGQNGLMQARVFKEVVDITGVVLTKLDGTAKGGIVFQVQHELGVPVKLVGLGEGADDLAPFTPEAFVDALLGT